MKNSAKLALLVVTTIVTAIALVRSFAQIPQPVLSIAPVGTNQFSISFTNYPPSTWDLQWTPVLANAAYSWTWAATGAMGQSNFVLKMDDLNDSPTAFFRTILDTNSIPLWKLADPNNPGLGILAVTIDSPTNCETIQ